MRSICLYGFMYDIYIYMHTLYRVHVTGCHTHVWALWLSSYRGTRDLLLLS